MAEHPGTSAPARAFFEKVDRQGTSLRAYGESRSGDVVFSQGDPSLPLALTGITQVFLLAMVLRDIDRGAISRDTLISDVLPNSHGRATSRNDGNGSTGPARVAGNQGLGSQLHLFFFPRTPQHVFYPCPHSPQRDDRAHSASAQQPGCGRRDCLDATGDRALSPRAANRGCIQLRLVGRHSGGPYKLWLQSWQTSKEPGDHIGHFGRKRWV